LKCLMEKIGWNNKISIDKVIKVCYKHCSLNDWSFK